MPFWDLRDRWGDGDDDDDDDDGGGGGGDDGVVDRHVDQREGAPGQVVAVVVLDVGVLDGDLVPPIRDRTGVPEGDKVVYVTKDGLFTYQHRTSEKSHSRSQRFPGRTSVVR